MSEYIDPRLMAFRRKKVKHLKLDMVLKKLLSICENPQPERIIVLTGPSGIGKTTVAESVERHVWRSFKEKIEAEPGFIPCLTMKAVTALDGNYNWKDAFTRQLAATNEVLIDRKALNRFEAVVDGKVMHALDGLVREELRRAIESMFHHRQVQIWMIEEAGAILCVKRGMHLTTQFEIIKSLSVVLQIPIVLIGAYDLLNIDGGNGQLLRRCDLIHFSRYVAGAKTGDVADEDHFRDILHAFLAAIEIEVEPNLLERCDYFMLKSLGCTGILKDWFDRSLVEALYMKRPFLSIDTLQNQALPNSSLKKILNEIKFGEERLRDISDDELSKELGLSYTPSIRESDLPKVGGVTDSPNKGRRRHVGKRGPSRDAVGGVHD
ncbi:AAA family ATPase [Caballeronia sp. LjRoot29]|uniref:AAA family ATPase n=1 Tax=Caballeronia sp. LjRoot29 TaxID=3342315 RepID=UPI003ED0E511